MSGKTSPLFWALSAFSLVFLIADYFKLKRLWSEFRRMSRAEIRRAWARAGLLLLFAAVLAVPLVVQYTDTLPGETFYAVFLPGYLVAVGVAVLLLSRMQVLGADTAMVAGAGGAVLICLGAFYGLSIGRMQDNTPEPQVAEVTLPASTTAKQITCTRRMVDDTPEMICLDTDGAEVGGASIRVVQP